MQIANEELYQTEWLKITDAWEKIAPQVEAAILTYSTDSLLTAMNTLKTIDAMESKILGPTAPIQLILNNKGNKKLRKRM